MKVEELKKNTFYTDGEKIIFKNNKGFRIITEVERNLEMFADNGNDYACISESRLTGEYRKVEKGEVLYNGDVKVVDTKNIEITNIKILNAKYDEKGYIINSKELKYETSKKVVNIQIFKY